MATAWDVPTVGWTVIVMGWLLSPIFTLLAPKILSYLCFDVKQMRQELKSKIIPELLETLGKVDQERMMQRGEVPHVSTLDEMAAWLRHAREDVEDIFDDAQENIVVADILNGWCMGVARIVQRGFWWLFFPMRLVDLETLKADLTKISFEVRTLPLFGNWASEMSPVDKLMTVPKTLRADMLKTILELRRRRQEDIPRRNNFLRGIYILLSRFQSEPAQEEAEDIVDKMVEWLRRAEEKDKMVRSGSSRIVSEGALPMSRAPSTSSRGDSTPSDSSGWWLSCWCSFVDLFKKCCSSIFYWLVHAIEVARSCRDESYKKVGITGYQGNASMLDLLPTAISRRNLKKRIEKVESTVNLVKGSPLLSVATKSKPNDIANKNKCQVRTDSIKPNDIANKNRCQVRADSNRKVFGREKLRDDIMAKLRETPHCDAPGSSTSPCYSVIGIYGISGSGKTTFARYIQDYIQKGCEEKLFDTVMCIHVSETLSVDAIFHEMLKDITENSHSNISDRADLKKKLKESLRDKRFFLILDDLWVKRRNDKQLEELISPLNAGLKGSKILVTARTKDAAGALCDDELIEMPDLDEDQYLKMFMHYALGGRSVAVKEFEQVGRLIAKKLYRSPIAAVTVAGRLGTNRDMNFWKNTANHETFNEAMDALWWSYQQLNPDIRRCFEFCNIFPRRSMLRRHELVRLWIAHGFVKTSATQDMEFVAEGYIQELVSCSFLQLRENSLFSEIWKDPFSVVPEGDYFTIHDLLHDLADKVAGSDFFIIENEGAQRGEGWKGDVPRDVRHLFVQHYDVELITEKILGLENLRTLIVEGGTVDDEKIINSICKRLPKLRVQIFGMCTTRPAFKFSFSIPESISQLKHLRYLAFRASYECTLILPSALAKCHHIQLLDFGNCHSLEFTSTDLINLRHIICVDVVEFPNIGRMTSLQTAPPTFTVRNEEGYEMKQLRDLNKLRGSLKIYGLENVKSKEEALEAKLAAKERLTKLFMNFKARQFTESRRSHGDDTRCSPEVEAEVLEGMCPPKGLETLEIRGYKGSRYPDWMVSKQNNGPEELQNLGFSECSQLGPGPELEAFPHLCLLVLTGCSWVTLPRNVEHLTSLKEIKINECMNIRSLPTLPQSLEFLKLYYCHYEFMGSCQTEGHPNWHKLKHIPKKTFHPAVQGKRTLRLDHTGLKQLRGINKLPDEMEVYGLENVKSKEEALEANLAAKEGLTKLTLEWRDGDDTRCGPEDEAEVLGGLCPPVGLQALQILGYRGSRHPDWMVGEHKGGPKDLQKLELHHWKQLGAAPELGAFIHLRELWLWNCSWDALPGSMEHLTLLSELWISGCMNIRSLPILPQYLEVFYLSRCDDELIESCQTEGHQNWHKIKHIPLKLIYPRIPFLEEKIQHLDFSMGKNMRVDIDNLPDEMVVYGLEHVNCMEEALEANLAAKEGLAKLTLRWCDDDDTRCSPEDEAEVLEGLCPPVGLETLHILSYRGSRYPDWMLGEHNGGPKYLQQLWFWRCSQLGPGPELEAFPHLHVLELVFCNWDALPGNMEQLTSLKKLKIHRCMNILSLPTLPQSLKEFDLSSCDDELMKGCQTEGDPNWLKIKDIPDKTFCPLITNLISEEDSSHASEAL